MRAVLDTHAFLWWVEGDGRVTDRVRQVVEGDGNEIFFRVVNAWEIVVKKKLKRLVVPDDVPAFVREEIAWYGFNVLPVSMEHALRVYQLPDHPRHKDPFDRLLAAQALAENMALISKDRFFEDYGVTRIW
jgi:PIN domain nuclease of toxin-antitoxin system